MRAANAARRRRSLVAAHLEQIYAKLGLENRAALAVRTIGIR